MQTLLLSVRDMTRTAPQSTRSSEGKEFLETECGDPKHDPNDSEAAKFVPWKQVLDKLYKGEYQKKKLFSPTKETKEKWWLPSTAASIRAKQHTLRRVVAFFASADSREGTSVCSPRAGCAAIQQARAILKMANPQKRPRPLVLLLSGAFLCRRRSGGTPAGYGQC